jgi:hypothetical protein
MNKKIQLLFIVFNLNESVIIKEKETKKTKKQTKKIQKSTKKIQENKKEICEKFEQLKLDFTQLQEKYEKLQKIIEASQSTIGITILKITHDSIIFNVNNHKFELKFNNNQNILKEEVVVKREEYGSDVFEKIIEEHSNESLNKKIQEDFFHSSTNLSKKRKYSI